jgi:site-specific DNA-methyltransferase (adenine-specific)
MEVNLIQGDCLTEMAKLPDKCVDLTVTSPPYDNLRTYKGFVFDFEGIAKQLFRITKDGGVVVWVVGDATINGSETGTSFKQALYFKEIGFNLHDTMIYEKAGMRYPDVIRYHSVFEFMFILSKGGPKTFNAIKDRENLWAGGKIARKSQVRQPDGTMRENSAYRNDKDRRVGKIGCRNNIWRYASGSENAKSKQHPATFPEDLATDHIISWSNEGDIVLDPMMGSGTTGKMSVKHNRNFIGIEISPEYMTIAEKCIHDAQQQMRLF